MCPRNPGYEFVTHVVHGDGESASLLAPSGCQLSNPSQVSSSAGRSAAASSSSSLETSGVSGTAATAGTPTRRPRAGSRTGSGPVDAVSPRRLLLVELRPVVKKGGCRCDTSRASSARRRTDCGMPTRGEPRSSALGCFSCLRDFSWSSWVLKEVLK